MPLPLFALGALGWARKNWKLLAIVGGAVLLLLVLWKVDSWRRAAAQLEEARQTAEETRKTQEADEALMNRKLELEADARRAAEQREADARIQAQQMAELARSLGSQIGAVTARQQRISSELALLNTPAEFEARIKADLAIRRPADTRPGFLREEFSEMAHRVANFPPLEEKYGLLEKRFSVLEGQVGAQQQEISAVREQLASEKRSRAALEEGYGKLKGHYVTLYNSIGVKKRAWKCFGIWKCGTRTLPTPAPTEVP